MDDYSTLDRQHKLELIDFLRPYMSDHKFQLIDRVIAQRTRHLTVVTENLYDPHNVNASLRSCESFGVQDVHVVDDGGRFFTNSQISAGASKWLTVHHHADTPPNLPRCVAQLKQDGYQIIATTLRDDAIPVTELDVTQKLALCFGTEETGLSAEAYQLADRLVTIPMAGFTQSFNISVAVSLCLQMLTQKLQNSAIDWQLSEDEKIDLKINWMARMPAHGDILVRNFLRSIGRIADENV